MLSRHGGHGWCRTNERPLWEASFTVKLHVQWHPYPESNWNCRFRRPMHYPLCYKGISGEHENWARLMSWLKVKCLPHADPSPILKGNSHRRKLPLLVSFYLKDSLLPNIRPLLSGWKCGESNSLIIPITNCKHGICSHSIFSFPKVFPYLTYIL